MPNQPQEQWGNALLTKTQTVFSLIRQGVFNAFIAELEFGHDPTVSEVKQSLAIKPVPSLYRKCGSEAYRGLPEVQGSHHGACTKSQISQFTPEHFFVFIKEPHYEL